MSKKGGLKRKREKEWLLKRGATHLFLFRPFHEETRNVFFPSRVTVVKAMGCPNCGSPNYKTYT